MLARYDTYGKHIRTLCTLDEAEGHTLGMDWAMVCLASSQGVCDKAATLGTLLLQYNPQLPLLLSHILSAVSHLLWLLGCVQPQNS